MMQQKESAARQALRKKRARKRAIRLAGAAALAAALGALTVCIILPGMDGGQGADEPKAQEQTATAALGTIEKTVFGAGEVQPASQPGVYAQTDGKIAEYLVEVGDSVKASAEEAAGTKCPRCWKHSTAANAEGLCPRCAEVMRSFPDLA